MHLLTAELPANEHALKPGYSGKRAAQVGHHPSVDARASFDYSLQLDFVRQRLGVMHSAACCQVAAWTRGGERLRGVTESGLDKSRVVVMV